MRTCGWPVMDLLSIGMFVKQEQGEKRAEEPKQRICKVKKSN